MSFERKVQRKALQTYDRIVKRGETRVADDGQKVHVLGSSQAEAIAMLRGMPVPPAPPGSGDTDRDDIDPVAYRVAMNRRKRARRARR